MLLKPSLSYLLFVLLIGVSSQAIAQDDIAVSGSTYAGGGTYTATGTENGKPFYTGSSFSVYKFYITWDSTSSKWVLYANIFGSLSSYYSAAIDSEFPPDGGWRPGGPLGSSQTAYPAPIFSGGVSVIVDETIPTITGSSPANGASDVPGDAKLTIDFSEPIKMGTGNVNIYKADGVLHQQLNITYANYATFSESSITLSPSGLASEHEYYVLFDEGAVLDLFNNSFILDDPSEWGFTTGVVSIVVDGAGNPNFNGTYYASDFSGGKLTFINGDYRVRYRSNNQAWIFENMADGSEGNYVSATLTDYQHPYPDDVGYEPTLKVGGIAATAPGPTVSGNFSPRTLELRLSYPEDDNKDFPLDGIMELKFNKEIQLGTGTIYIRLDKGTTDFEVFDVSTSSAVTVDGKSLFIDPVNDFADDQEYHVIAEAGVIQDLEGNDWGGINSWAATNGVLFEAHAGEVIVEGSGWRPFNLALGESIVSNGKVSYHSQNTTYGVSLYWSDELVPNRWILKKAVSGQSPVTYVNYSESTLPPDTGWEPQAITELTPNSKPAPYPVPTLRGEVEAYIPPDVFPPAIASLSPGNEGAFVKADANLTMVFDEEIVIGSGNITIYHANGSVFETIDVASGQVSIDEGALVIDPSGYFGSTEEYYVLADAGIVTDTRSNAFDGILGSGVWAFESGPLLEVTSAGTSAVNGLYHMVGYESERPLFAKLGAVGVFGNGLQWWPNDETGYWILSNGSNYYYRSNKDSVVASTHEWIANSGESPGSAPMPILIYDDAFEFVRPTYSMSTSSENPTNEVPIILGYSFSEAVSGFSSTDLSIENAVITAFTGSGSEYAIELTPSAPGSVTVDLTGSVYDLVGNPLVRGAGLDFETNYDVEGPEVTISSAQRGSTSLNSFKVCFQFNETIQNFNEDSVYLKNATLLSTEMIGGDRIEATISVGVEDSIKVMLRAGGAEDLLGQAGFGSDTLRLLYNPFALQSFVYDTIGGESAYDFEVAADGSVYISGNTRSEGSTDFTTVKFNPDNSIEWTKIEGGTSTDEAFRVLPDEEHVYTLGAITNESLESEGSVIKYDLTGRKISSATFRSNAASNAVQTDNYIFIPWGIDGSDQYRPIVRIDKSDLTVTLATEVYSRPGIRGIAVDDDNSAVYYTLNDASKSPMEIIVGKHGFDLSESWKVTYQPSVEGVYVQDITVDSNGDVLIFATDNSSSQNHYLAKLSKMDGSRLWERTVYSEYGGWAANIKMVVSGTNTILVNSLLNGSDNSDITITGYDVDGNESFFEYHDIGGIGAYNSVKGAALNDIGELVVLSEHYNDSHNVVSIDKFDISDGSIIRNIDTYEGFFELGTNARKLVLKGSSIYALMESDKGSYDYAMEVIKYRDEGIAEMITWNGSSWSNGTGPSPADDVLISSSLNLSSLGNLNVNDLSVASGVDLVIDGERTLIVNGDLNISGTLEVASGASLITMPGATVTGEVSVKRNTRYGDGKYSFVGTPMQEDARNTGAMLGSHVYSYNESTAYGDDGLARWEGASADVLVPGIGYTQAMQQEIAFVGIPNADIVTVSGTYTQDVDEGYEGWNLVANPYTAAIDVVSFLSDNPNTTGAIYIWDDNGSDQQRGSNSDYIVINAAGSTANSNAGSAIRHNDHIGSAQGFFVQLVEGESTNIVFDPGQRVVGSNGDDHFFRKQSLARARVNLTNQSGLFKQTLIAWSGEVDAQRINKQYDAPVFSSESPNAVYTYKLGQELAIQTINSSIEELALGLNLETGGIYTISADLTEYHDILLLRDNYSGELIDLTKGSYSFQAPEGKLSGRFALVVKGSVLGSSHIQQTDIYVADNILYLNKGDNMGARTFSIYSVSGQFIMKTISNGTRNQIDLNHLNKGIYIVTDGHTSTKFIIK